MSTTRRHVLRSALAVSAAFAGLHRAVHGPLAHALADSPAPDSPALDFGPLLDDPFGVIDLPKGFSYRVISKRGERMDDGLFVPGQHDGMGAFPGPDGTTLLVRNHELSVHGARFGAFGWSHELAGQLKPEQFYDPGTGAGPSIGGTTTVVYDTRNQRVLRHFLSLAGTEFNCAGGVTPWGSWITCEESTQLVDKTHAREHGYCFEVPASAEPGLAKPIPLKAMGRFRHEAVAVHPPTGIVYQSEDIDDGCFYRFIPKTPGKLAEGGRLQALAFLDKPSADTRNREKQRFRVGKALPVKWIDLDDVESPEDDLRLRAFEAGAARFARGEGCCFGHDAVYLVCTSGGSAKLGQVWKYVPSPAEGTSDEAKNPARIQLFIEPNDSDLVRNADNVVVAPWGDLILAEDSGGNDRLVLVSPSGQCRPFAYNRLTGDEFAGPCFSPDGSTLFANIQGMGITLAITGPWPKA